MAFHLISKEGKWSGPSLEPDVSTGLSRTRVQWIW